MIDGPSHQAGGPAFPPEPWHLAGSIHLSVWRVRPELLPQGCLPAGSRPVTVMGHALVGTAFAVYEAPGILAYNELLAAVLLRAGLRPRASVIRIWVDSPASLAGGRSLWDIPKELADFELRPEPRGGLAASAAAHDGQSIARATFRGGPALPVPWPVRLETVQRPLGPGRHPGPTCTPAEVRASLAPAMASWQIAAQGPLGFLKAATPTFSCRLAPMSMRFGRP